MEDFINEIRENPNKVNIKILSQSANTITAEITPAYTVKIPGTPITAEKMNEIKNLAETSATNSIVANGNATEANTNSRNANEKAGTALINSEQAVEIASSAKIQAEEALEQVVEKQGTKVYVNDSIVETFDADLKVEKDGSNLDIEDVQRWRDKLQISNLPIGLIIPSAFYQDSINLHLLDGTELNKVGSYSSFYQWIINNIDKVPHYENDGNKTALEKYQEDIETYGQCGKFVITDTYVKIPKITEFIASSNCGEEIGLAQLDEFKSHTHIQNPHRHSVYRAGNGGGAWDGAGLAGSPRNDYAGHPDSVDFTTATNQNSGGSETRPKNIRYPYYIVVANKANEVVAVNTQCVKTTGNQIISGVKTFEDGILVPDLEV